MTNKVEDFPLFDGKYLVDISQRGKVTVKSRALYGKALKVYGKKKDGARFVNLTSVREFGPEPYDLDVIANHCLNGADLIPMSDEQRKEAIKRDDLPPLLNTKEEIETLPQIVNNFGNTVYVEELEAYTRYYTKQYLNFKSNGLSKFFYRVATHSQYDKHVTNQTTDSFIVDGLSVAFYNANQMSDDDLEQVFNLINEERKKRKLEQFRLDWEPVRSRYDKPLSIDYQIAQENLIGKDSWYGCD